MSKIAVAPQALTTDGADYGRFLVAMLVVAGLLFGLRWALQWFAQRQGMMAVKKNKDITRIEVVAQQAVDLKRRLVVARWDNREFLLLLNADSTVVVAEQPMASTPQITP